MPESTRCEAATRNTTSGVPTVSGWIADGVAGRAPPWRCRGGGGVSTTTTHSLQPSSMRHQHPAQQRHRARRSHIHQQDVAAPRTTRRERVRRIFHELQVDATFRERRKQHRRVGRHVERDSGGSVDRRGAVRPQVRSALRPSHQPHHVPHERHAEARERRGSSTSASGRDLEDSSRARSCRDRDSVAGPSTPVTTTVATYVRDDVDDSQLLAVGPLRHGGRPLRPAARRATNREERHRSGEDHPPRPGPHCALRQADQTPRGVPRGPRVVITRHE